MLDHISIPVADLARAAGFYDAVLATLGLVRRKRLEASIGYGPGNRPAPVFWLLAADPEHDARSATPGLGLHISFEASDRAQVNEFFDTALRHGGRDAGPPGERPAYTSPFYGAFVFDLDGFKIEAVCRVEP